MLKNTLLKISVVHLGVFFINTFSFLCLILSFCVETHLHQLPRLNRLEFPSQGPTRGTGAKMQNLSFPSNVFISKDATTYPERFL